MIWMKCKMNKIADAKNKLVEKIKSKSRNQLKILNVSKINIFVIVNLFLLHETTFQVFVFLVCLCSTVSARLVQL